MSVFDGEAEIFWVPDVFPTVQWKNETATFVPCLSESEEPTGVARPAALVFPFYGDRVVLADIETRGWCIPSGHLEAGETAEDAVRRESVEEAGATLGKVAYLGYFVLTDRVTGVVRHAPTFIASVSSIGQIPDGTESRGATLANVEDVATLYFAWDALLAAVFALAYAKKAERLPVGVSVSDLMEKL
ncbi:MAG: NUDIX domain-containing protein [Armatimonadetes bacterium]|nr:NUDIX domain-containing protein [Armatimonadota bacterium]